MSGVTALAKLGKGLLYSRGLRIGRLDGYERLIAAASPSTCPAVEPCEDRYRRRGRRV